jgi:hypothetical protein
MQSGGPGNPVSRCSREYVARTPLTILRGLEREKTQLKNLDRMLLATWHNRWWLLLTSVFQANCAVASTVGASMKEYRIASPTNPCALTRTGTSQNLEPFHAVTQSGRHWLAAPTKG